MTATVQALQVVLAGSGRGYPLPGRGQPSLPPVVIVVTPSGQVGDRLVCGLG